MAAEENALIKEFRFIVNYLGQIGKSIIKERRSIANKIAMDLLFMENVLNKLETPYIKY